MNRYVKCYIALFSLLALAFGTYSPVSAQTTKTFTISAPSESTFYGKFLGFGAEFDPFYWNQNNLNRGANQAGWDLITSRIKSLNIKVVRMMMQLSWAQKKQDLNQWDWTNAQMQSVFKYLDFACSNGITVILTDWGWAVRGDLYSSPTDNRYAQGVAEYIKEFIQRRGYTCIKYLVIGNEPDNEIQKDFGQAAYETMYKNVDAALKANGMRSQIKLTGPDMGGQWDFMKNSVSDLKGILDTYDFHRYASTDETANTNLAGSWDSLWSHLDMWRGEVNSRDTNSAGKQVLLTEMGNSGGGTNTHPDIDTFKYALHMADYGTTLLTTRVNTGIAWEMFDLYYFDGGQFMQWGMWKYLDSNYAIRPWGQAFGLLMKHAPQGSTQAAVNGTPTQTPALSQQRVGAVKRPDNTWGLFLVNREASTVNLQISLPDTPTYNFAKYVFDQNTNATYANQIVIPSSGKVTSSKSFTISVPAQTFIVLSEQADQGTPAGGSTTCADMNGDAFIDLTDYGILAANFFKTTPTNSKADINHDGIVDLSDYGILASSFFKTCV
jgi:hypothetical protein